MGEFDLSLIREFRSRPAFYDRNEPRFKDKLYTACEWQAISNKLGYDVALLKDRMLQLRNRYNLEKRRIEQLGEWNPDKVVESPWPLFEHLQFLSDHIRSRRSYKSMVPLYDNSTNGQNNSEAGDVSPTPSTSTTGAANAVQPFANGLLALKVEEPEEDNTDDSTRSGDYRQSVEGDGYFITPSNPAATTSQQQSSSSSSQRQHSSTNNTSHHQASSRSLRPRQLSNVNTPPDSQSSSSRYPPPFVQVPSGPALRSSLKRSSTTSFYTRDNAMSSSSSSCLGKKIHLDGGSAQKYAAFGDFICSSLLELPANTALLLVEKFTSELVQGLIKKNDSAASSTNNTNDCGPSNGH